MVAAANATITLLRVLILIQTKHKYVIQVARCHFVPTKGSYCFMSERFDATNLFLFHKESKKRECLFSAVIKDLRFWKEQVCLMIYSRVATRTLINLPILFICCCTSCVSNRNSSLTRLSAPCIQSKIKPAPQDCHPTEFAPERPSDEKV